MQHNKNRVEWIDVFKGVLIILMIIGHSTSPFVKWIYLFHMPAFMFISGYTAIPGKYPFHKIAFKRVKRILIPYIFWNCWDYPKFCVTAKMRCKIELNISRRERRWLRPPCLQHNANQGGSQGAPSSIGASPAISCPLTFEPGC